MKHLDWTDIAVIFAFIATAAVVAITLHILNGGAI